MTRILIAPILVSLFLWALNSNAQQLLQIPTATEDYKLSYVIENSTVTFEIIANTSGYVGFGFTNVSGMVQSDIFIGGVEDGSVYFGDYTSYATSTPSLDAVQDWKIISGSESGGITRLRFSRLLATGDPMDIVIEDKLMSILWSMGSKDQLSYHGFSRSTLKYNLVAQTNGGENPEPPPTPPPFDF